MALAVSRRHLLSAFSVLAAGVAARPSLALTMDTLGPVARANYLNACSQREQDFHKQLISDIEATLNGRQLTAEEKEAIRVAATCPICGCPLFQS
jgi:hypothetical protein